MGQYHLIVNLDKMEFIHPHAFGNGLKICEQVFSHPSTGQALLILLAVSNGRGGGDLDNESPDIVGRWGGDRIAVVGDYGESADLPSEFNAETIYERCVPADANIFSHVASVNEWRAKNDNPPIEGSECFTDITARVVKVYEHNGSGLTLDTSGHGWGEWS
jgi:hypothetical protein